MRASLWTAVAALVGTGCAHGGAAGPGVPSLEGAVAEAMAAPLDRTHWGVLVSDAASGRVLAAEDADRHFIPASNTKLVVTAVGLGVLGPDYRYRTELQALGRADTVARALLAVGSGDPTWSDRFHEGEWAVLESLADSVVAAGIRRVAGPLVVDASRFDRQTVNPAWEVGDLVWSYAPPVAAFAVAEGTFRLIVEPGSAPGEPARVVAVAPEGLVPVAAAVLTDTAGARTDLDVERGPWSDTLRVRGLIAVDAAPDTSRLAVTDPARFAGRVLRAMLEARGVEVEGGVEVVRDAAEAAALRAGGEDATPVAVWTSPPLAEVVASILRPSQNWIAEQLLKTLGAERMGRGSWPAGLAVERRYLVDEAGIDPAAFFLRDASGLSAQNLLTPGAVVRLLAHARGQPWGPAYRSAMAEPGRPGTLARRLSGLEDRVAAKTGTITHVNALSGYLVTDTGRELLFSVLTNASGQPSAGVRAAIDRIVHAAAQR